MAAPTLTATAPAGVTTRGVVPAAVLGLGSALPGTVVTNADLEARLDTSDEWIRTRTGIEQRHAAGPTESTGTLATDAARAALADAGVSAADLDAILVATTTPDHRVPGTAPAVAAALGSTTPAADLNAACSGFVYGLRVASGLLATGAERVLLVGAETLTRVVDPDDRSTAVLFGDGAAAVVLGPGTGSLGPFDLGCDGGLKELLYIPTEGPQVLRMQGREVYRHAVTRMVGSASAVLDAAGLGPTDVHLLVAHQANLRILDAVVQRLGIPADRAHVTVDRHGNTSAASIPLALADAARAGRLPPGARVLLTAFGAGLTWGSCLLTWQEETR